MTFRCCFATLGYAPMLGALKKFKNTHTLSNRVSFILKSNQM